MINQTKKPAKISTCIFNSSLEKDLGHPRVSHPQADNVLWGSNAKMLIHSDAGSGEEEGVTEETERVKDEKRVEDETES